MELLNLYLYELSQTFIKELPVNLVYFLCALVLLMIAKLARDITTRGVDDDKQITEHDNPAFGIYTAGYYAGVGLSFVGVFMGEDAGFISSLIEIFQYGITGIVFLGVSYVISDKVYLSKFKIMPSLTGGNTAVALFLVGRFIFSGLTILAAIHGEGIWFISFVYFLLGEVGCYLGFKIYTFITPYDDFKALEDNNYAVGVVTAGVLISLGLLMLNALWGDLLNRELVTGRFLAIAGMGR